MIIFFPKVLSPDDFRFRKHDTFILHKTHYLTLDSGLDLFSVFSEHTTFNFELYKNQKILDGLSDNKLFKHCSINVVVMTRLVTAGNYHKEVNLIETFTKKAFGKYA